MPENEELKTTEEAADYLGVTRQRVRQLVVAEVLAGKKYGRDYLVEARSLEQYSANRKKAGRPKK